MKRHRWWTPGLGRKRRFRWLFKFYCAHLAASYLTAVAFVLIPYTGNAQGLAAAAVFTLLAPVGVPCVLVRAAGEALARPSYSGISLFGLDTAPSAVLLYAGYLGPFIIVWSILRRTDVAARRSAEGLCTRCGYDLRASPGRCPECGKIVTN